MKAAKKDLGPVPDLPYLGPKNEADEALDSVFWLAWVEDGPLGDGLWHLEAGPIDGRGLTAFAAKMDWFDKWCRKNRPTPLPQLELSL